MQELQGRASRTYLLTNLVRGMEGEDDQEISTTDHNNLADDNTELPSIEDGQKTQVRFANIDDQASSDQDDIYEQLYYANHFSSGMNHINDQDF